MVFTKKIPAERFAGFDLQKGDTLQVVAVDTDVVLKVRRTEAKNDTLGKASEWLRSARGSVKLEDGESPDDVRLSYYDSKYGSHH